MKFINTIVIICFCLLNTSQAQLNDIVISVEKISSTCDYGRKLIFRDTNKDNIYDEIRRYDCDNKMYEDSLKVIGDGLLISGLVGELQSGDFIGYDLRIRVYDPFKNETLGYVYYDSLLMLMVLDFGSVWVFDDMINGNMSNFNIIASHRNGLIEINIPMSCFDNLSINVFDLNGTRVPFSRYLINNENNNKLQLIIGDDSKGLYFIIVKCAHIMNYYRLLLH